ncbi:hypothetical protein AVEN_12882-1 [Araneus ventricosus]|uniref:Uncharacterized protein n=1 Tax=Araneus ventricosus TaxID=182803 RepID=A0A4Y2HL95_ARAVE|nr:hypothetical protein AVEN_12882-1 [Araneus ventricosus]
MDRHARPTRGGILLSMRSRKQTERRQLLMESSLTYPRGKEKQKSKAEGGGEVKLERRPDTGYLGVVKPVTSEEDVPLRGEKESSMFDGKSGKLVTAPLKYPRLVSGTIPSQIPNCASYMSSSTFSRENLEIKKNEIRTTKRRKGSPGKHDRKEEI